MSAKNDVESETDEEMSRCASCGTTENDDVKLKKCTACYLVRYCGVKCQKDHRKKHKKECKKRAAELHDELLFKQPESTYLGDCPICCLPIPIPFDVNTSVRASVMPCCSKMICGGCNFAHQKRQIDERLEMTCLFCRHPTLKSQIEADRMQMKRVEANDPIALREVGTTRYREGDYEGAIEYWKKAVEIGDVPSHYQLSCLYGNGEGDERNEKKELYHLEQAAIGGDPNSRHNLGIFEWNNRQCERAAKHFIIAANLGHVESLANLKKLYKRGVISKGDFASTLRAHNAAVDAMKSPQREAAADAESMGYSVIPQRGSS